MMRNFIAEKAIHDAPHGGYLLGDLHQVTEWNLADIRRLERNGIA